MRMTGENGGWPSHEKSRQRGWRGLRGQTLLGVDERVNRGIVGP